MLTIGTAYDPRKHYVFDEDPFIETLQAAVDNDRLFLYFHRDHLSWVLAQWMDDPEDHSGPLQMMELEVFERDHPQHDPSTCMAYLVARCTPVADATKTAIRDAHREKKRVERARVEAQAEYQQYMVKHHTRNLDDVAAHRAKTNQDVYEVPTDDDGTRELMDLARTMNRVTGRVEHEVPK